MALESNFIFLAISISVALPSKVMYAVCPPLPSSLLNIKSLSSASLDI